MLNSNIYQGWRSINITTENIRLSVITNSLIHLAHLALSLGLGLYLLRHLDIVSCVLGIRYIHPLGVEHGDLRALRLLPDVSLGLRCETPSEKSSGICLVLAIRPLPVVHHPNTRSRIPQGSASSSIH